MSRSDANNKMPAFMFYTADWLSDEALRSCSIAARGLWIDLLSLMHKGDRRGYLQLNGKPFSNEQLARMTGCSTEDFSRLLQELLTSGTASVSDTGVYYSRRMVRDEKKRLQDNERVKRHRERLKGDKKLPCNADVTRNVTHLKRPCTEYEDETVNQGEGGAGEEGHDPPDPVVALWNQFSDRYPDTFSPKLRTKFSRLIECAPNGNAAQLLEIAFSQPVRIDSPVDYAIGIATRNAVKKALAPKVAAKEDWKKKPYNSQGR